MHATKKINSSLLRYLIVPLVLACTGFVTHAHAQNILILTTGDRDDGPQTENYYQRGIIREFGAPLTEATCSNTPQTVTDPHSGLSKTVTCNSSELVNGTALDPSVLFAPGYDLVVVSSAYSTIDSADWSPLQTAISTRLVRGVVFFIDTVNSTNANRVRPLVEAALNSPVPALGNGSAYAGVNAHALNTAATGAADFTGILDTFTLGAGYFPYTNVPYTNALFLAAGTAGPITSGVTDAVGILVPSTTSFGGNGGCIFTANDIGWGNLDAPANGWGANNGKVGQAFLKSFNNTSGPCAAAAATAAEVDVSKSTTVNTNTLPANGSTVPYTVTVSNTSAAVANNIAISDSAPAGLSFGTWTCTVLNAGAAPATTCPAVAAGDLNVTVNLSAGAQLQFTVSATVVDNQADLTNIATLTLPAGVTCVNDRAPCNATVSFRQGGASTPPLPVPALGSASLLLLGALVSAGAAIRRNRKR